MFLARVVRIALDLAIVRTVEPHGADGMTISAPCRKPVDAFLVRFPHTLGFARNANADVGGRLRGNRVAKRERLHARL